MRWMLAIVLLTSTTQPATTEPSSAIRRFIEAGHPELAEAAAKDLMAQGNFDPLAIGVMGYVYAQRGETGAAIQQLRMALLQAPDEPFLLRTAGQIVAWYDSTADRSKLTATDVQMLEAVRMQSREKRVFADAYKESVLPPITTAPPTPPTVVVNPPPVIVEYPTYQTYDPGYYYYPIFVDPFFRHGHEHGHVRPRPQQTKGFGELGHDRGMVPVRPTPSRPPTVRPPPAFRDTPAPRSGDGFRSKGMDPRR
jgi:hypothetical protein